MGYVACARQAMNAYKNLILKPDETVGGKMVDYTKLATYRILLRSLLFYVVVKLGFSL